jgi:hypothetical protein
MRVSPDRSLRCLIRTSGIDCIFGSEEYISDAKLSCVILMMIQYRM